MTYAILPIPAATYQAIRGRLEAIDARIGQGPVYVGEYVRPKERHRPEHIVFGTVGLEVAPPTDEEVEAFAARLLRALKADDESAMMTSLDPAASVGVDGYFDFKAIARSMLTHD